MISVVLLVSVLVPAVLVVMVVIVVVALTRQGNPQQPGWQPVGRPATGAAMTTASGAGGVGVWNAQVMGDGVIGMMGGSLDSRFGRFELTEGTLAFVPDGAEAPAWRVSCSQLGASHHGLFSVAGVTLRGPMGEVRCNVSTEHINRFSRNSAKTIRETRHARDFVAALQANGAGVA